MARDVPTRLRTRFRMLGNGLLKRGPAGPGQRLPCRLLPSLLVPLACGRFYPPCFLPPGLHGLQSILGATRPGA